MDLVIRFMNWKKEGIPDVTPEKRSVNQGAYVNPRIQKSLGQESENQDAELKRLQYEKNQAAGEAMGTSIVAATNSTHRTKLSENALMYSLEPSL